MEPIPFLGDCFRVVEGSKLAPANVKLPKMLSLKFLEKYGLMRHKRGKLDFSTSLLDIN